MSVIKRWWWVLPVVVIIVAGGALVNWVLTAAEPMPEALAALQSDVAVRVDDEPWFVFSPAESSPTTGLIFYPGGRVDPRAYAPYMREIAAAGYLSVIVPMPLQLAVLSPESASEVIVAFPDIQHWVVGGHSLGGAMAARFVYGYPAQVQGLALVASYPAAANDLSAFETLDVVSIYGSLDGLAEVETVEGSRALLPADGEFVLIEGGNHAQFGWYGVQGGDNAAAISREEQQRQSVEALLGLLARVSAPE